jgi:hypothetical protein
LGKTYILKERGTSVIKELFDSLPETISLEEYLRENMELFLKSRKSVNVIYTELKEKGIVKSSYSWFSRLFSKAKANYLLETAGKSDASPTQFPRKVIFRSHF